MGCVGCFSISRQQAVQQDCKVFQTVLRPFLPLTYDAFSMSSVESRNPGTSRQPSGTNITREEFDRLFAAISDVKGQISSMKRDLTKEWDEANDQLVKRLKLEKKAVFGHERQHEFNVEVQEKLVSVLGALEDTPLDTEKAKKILKEGEEMIKEWQRLIRVADRSEHGWVTVDE